MGRTLQRISEIFLDQLTRWCA